MVIFVSLEFDFLFMNRGFIFQPWFIEYVYYYRPIHFLGLRILRQESVEKDIQNLTAK